MTDVATLRARLASRAATPPDLAEEALEAIAAGAGLNAFVAVTGEDARRAAAQSAARWAAGAPLGPLDGIPVAVKDNMAMAGTVTTAGHAGGHGLDARDADPVARLRAAGAVVVGKTNMDEGALGATCANPHHGTAVNPLAAGHTPGGSSGGSAVAVAAGFVSVALGSDTMGSVRIPASYCGLYGLKPTRGAVARTGLAMLAPSLDTIGVLATTADDLASAHAVLCGYDAADLDSVPLDERVAPAGPRADPVSVGLVDLPGVTLEPAVADALRRAADGVAALGARVSPVAVAGWDPARTRKDGLLVIEAEAAMLHGADIEANPERYGEAFRGMIAFGQRLAAPRLARAAGTLHRAAVGTRRALREVDVLLLPTTPQRSFPHAAPTPVDQGELTALANVAGLPAVQIPVPVAGGLPAGVQLVGPAWSEGWLVPLAGRLGGILAGR